MNRQSQQPSSTVWVVAERQDRNNMAILGAVFLYCSGTGRRSPDSYPGWEKITVVENGRCKVIIT
jgi:hypothetical protein